MIPTKIEFFIGDVTSTEFNGHLNYTSLGFVTMSDNIKTNFKSRELKSVYLDTIGINFKLVIYNNYANHLNTYNQVGIIALNLIGDYLSEYPPTEYPPIDTQVDDALFPSDDLASSLYQDPEVSSIIHKLIEEKSTSVREEDFEKAKVYRDAIIELQKISSKLGCLEFEKQKAIQLENYERADMMKKQLNKYRTSVYESINLSQLLPHDNAQEHCKNSSNSEDFSSISIRNRPRRPTPEMHLQSLDVFKDATSFKPPAQLIEEDFEEATEAENPLREVVVEEANIFYRDPDDRPLPVEAPVDESEIQGMESKSELVDSEELSSETQRLSSIVIEMAGMEMAKNLYSKNWSLRENALMELKERMSRDPLSPPAIAKNSENASPDPRGEVKCALFVLQKSLGDQVLSVFVKACSLIKELLVEFVEKHKGIPKTEIPHNLDQVFIVLLRRVSDPAHRIRDMAKSQILSMSKWPSIHHSNLFWAELQKPFRPNTIDRLSLNRVDLLMQLFSMHGLVANNQGLSLNAIAKFCSSGLQHRSGHVRESVEALLVTIYKQAQADGRMILRGVLPQEHMKLHKQPLYRRLFKKFDDFDGQQTGPLDMHTLVSAKRYSVAQNPRRNTTHESEADILLGLEKTCIFCGEKNDNFTEEALDLHYWRSCPMLKRCPNCKHVVEIPNYTEHLLTDCKSGLLAYERCPRCSEAVPKGNFNAHVMTSTCKPSSNPAFRCPLCHQDLPLPMPNHNAEDVWRTHFLLNGCSHNPRKPKAHTRS
ncbi:hypothetical protein Ciccas_005501 [Cichlidogyrus casuarinus]|uniref:UVR domain-containing protein n=1 Tax=Cichlidogyrus casuarinus TaxID=1844966 RepID=A0ABD2Q8I3_9PLAT